MKKNDCPLSDGYGHRTPPRFMKGLLMRMACILVILTTAIVAGFAEKGSAQRVSIHRTDATLKAVIADLRAQTGYGVMIEKELLARAPRVTVDHTDADLSTVLDALTKQLGYTYAIEEKERFVVIEASDTSAPSSFRARRNDDEKSPPEGLVYAIPTVSGKIVDSTGTALSGASIRVLDAQGQRTSLQTQTDRNGEFTLRNVPENALLEISFVGYQTVTIHARADFGSIRLTAAEAALDEVVVRGYYTTTKELNTGSVRTLTAAEMRRQPVGNPLQSLQGRISGLNIRQQNGIPGGNLTVNLRGRNSIANGTDPLYVIDGIPYPSQSLSSLVGGNPYGSLSPLNSLSIESIESITVLKDADATAIYGSQGANGVILITTKSGKAGKTTIEANFNTGWGQVERRLDLMNTEQYLEMRLEAFANDNRTTIPANQHDINGNWDQTRYTDWQEVFIGGTSQLNNAHLRVSGGSNQTQFSIGSNYRKETTVFPGNYFDQKFAVQSNITHQSENNRFKVSLISSYNANDNQLPNQNFVERIFLAPNAPALLQEDGELNWENFTWDNPFAQLRQRGRSLTDNLVANTMVSYGLLPGLTIQASLGYNKLALKSNKIFPISSFSPTNPEIPARRRNVIGTNSIKSWIAEPQVNYSRKFGRGSLELLVGSTFRESTQEILDQTASNFPSDALIDNIRAAASLTTDNYGYSQYRYNALYGRAGFTWSEKYIVNLTGRRDGSSRFGPSRQFGNFGAIGGAWLFSKEDFMLPLQHWLNFGKLRASYGLTGNDQLPNYQYLSTYQSLNYTYLTNTGLFPSRHTNPNFGWESVKKLEIGAEFGLFNDRIRIESGWYRNRTENQLVGYPLPMMTGFNSIQANLPAVIENRGLEIDASFRLGAPNKFQWQASLNISFPRNKLISYPDIETSNYRNTYEVGKSLFIRNRYTFAGIDPQTGLYTFVDKNDDGNLTFDSDGSKIVTEGKYFSGISNTFSYRQWECNIFIQFVRQIDNRFVSYGQPGFFDAFSSLGNQPTWMLNRWQNIGDDNKSYQKFSSLFPPTTELFNNSDFLVQDASFIRLKNIEIAWSASTKLLSITKLKQLRVYSQAQNLLTITKYQGLDPESGTGASLPPIRMVTVGMQIGL